LLAIVSTDSVAVGAHDFTLCNLSFDFVKSLRPSYPVDVRYLVFKMVEVHHIERIRFTTIGARYVLSLLNVCFAFFVVASKVLTLLLFILVWHHLLRFSIAAKPSAARWDRGACSTPRLLRADIEVRVGALTLSPKPAPTGIDGRVSEDSRIRTHTLRLKRPVRYHYAISPWSGVGRNRTAVHRTVESASTSIDFTSHSIAGVTMLRWFA
jgi:hypothetical protein